MKNLTQWYSLVLGIVLILVGIDNWAHIAPGVQLESNFTAVVVMVVGLIGVWAGWKKGSSMSSA